MTTYHTGILKKHWDNTLPVNLFSISKRMGVELHEFQSDGTSRGKLEGDGFTGHIFYDPSNGNVMNRFVIAHLLGHFVMGHGSVDQVVGQNLSTDSPEEKDKMANHFALNMLIPTEALAKLVNSGQYSDVKELALAFEVSPNAIAEAFKYIKV